MKTGYKDQHFVPQCYLKAWLDPSSMGKPKVQPYVWIFDNDGKNPRKKSPANLFTEKDIYTISRADGQRDLYLEHGFQELEDRFTRIRNLKFNRNQWPDDEQLVWLLAFVATMQTRTKANRDHQREQWARIRKQGEDMQAAYEAASPEKKALFSSMVPPSLSRNAGKGMTLENVREMETYPIQLMMGTVVQTVLPMFQRMSLAVLQTQNPIGFVTSDHPCTWYDPESYKLPPIYRGAGLGFRSTEVTLPISPRQCLLISHHKHLKGYIDVNQETVDTMNRRQIGHCDKNFISRSQEIRKTWFDIPPMPEDAWEKVRERKIASGEWTE